jgi:hypothetical protein
MWRIPSGTSSITGAPITSFPLSGLIGSCGNSGIAVGGTNLYLANNGCSEIYVAPKTLTSSALFATFPARLEDLECDNITFAGSGKGAIWSIDAYDRTLNAWEIPLGTCSFGGGGSSKVQWMTGGGRVFTTKGDPVTHGFELYCDASKGNLQINWGKGNKFHLGKISTASCTDDPAIVPNPPASDFDTYTGTGTGKYNNTPGATVSWTFTDAGEPGKNDTATTKVWDAASNLVLDVTGPLNSGNHQAHTN